VATEHGEFGADTQALHRNGSQDEGVAREARDGGTENVMAAVVAGEWVVLVALALVVVALVSGTRYRRGGRPPAGSGPGDPQPVPVRVEEAGRRR
jgi:hypothetical protein